MFGFYDSGYVLARLIFERLLGLVYLVAFWSTLAQFRALCGDHGLLPARRYLRAAGFRRAPSLFQLHYSDRMATVLAGLGVLLSAAVVAGMLDVVPLPVAMAIWACLWVLYLSFVHAGRTFYGFVFATGPVEVTATGEDCVAQETVVELDLDAGWNWVAWSFVYDEGDAFSHIRLASVEAPADPVLTTVPPTF